MKTTKLPKELKLDLWELLDSNTKDRVCELVNDYLADTYGYCNNGFCYDMTIEVADIDWDTED